MAQFQYAVTAEPAGSVARFRKVPSNYRAQDGEFLVPNVKAGWRVGSDGASVRPPTEAEITADAAPTIADVKAEAARRILAILPEWKQRNLTARAAELAKIGEANWTAEQAAEWAAGQALWDQVKAIRAASDALEAMDPIPSDYADDRHWGE